jgi:2-iminobutanoate/2-iminopropanoate deaminase
VPSQIRSMQPSGNTRTSRPVEVECHTTAPGRRLGRSMCTRSLSPRAHRECQAGLADQEEHMDKQVITADVPATGGPFNLCVRHGDMVYVSGLPPFDESYCASLRAARANGRAIPPFPDTPFEVQARRVMDHLAALVEAAGSNMECLLKVVVWLKDQSDQEEFDRIYRGYFSSAEALPTRTRMQAGRTPMDCALEIDAIGYVPDQ